MNWCGGVLLELQTIFVYIVSILFLLIAYIIPKKINLSEIHATSLFATVVGLIVDTILAVKYKFYVLDKEGVQIPPLIGQIILYYVGSLIILNYFPFNRSKLRKVAYILFCSLVAVLFELICYQFKFIKYNEWNIGYSALCYPFIIIFFTLHYKFFRWLANRNL